MIRLRNARSRHDPVRYVPVMRHRRYRLARVRLAIAEDLRYFADFRHTSACRARLCARQDGYVHVRMVMCHIAHEIDSDKPAPAGHNDVARLENLTTHDFRVPAGLHHGALVGDVSNR